MSVDVFTLSCSALKTAKLVAFKGIEHISRPYEIDVFFTVPSGTDVRGAVGEKVTLCADRGEDSQPMYWHGIFARVRMLRTVAERTLYRGTVVPKLWRLRHSLRSSVFTKKKIKAYLSDTLKDGGLGEGDFRFHIDESRYPEEEFVAQYRETHLDFFHRWLEREGLYYYFEHEADDNGQEILVIVDDKGQHGPLSGDGHVRYYPAGGDVSSGECLHELECDYQALPAGVLVTDYNYANPAAPVQGEHAVSATGKGRIRDYGYRVFDEGEATRLAEVKAQAMGCRELTLRAVGNALGLRAGYTVDIDDLGAEEIPSGYLAFEVRHAGAVSGATADVSAYTGLHGNETYRVEIHAIPKDVQYRCPQMTAWPRIYGFENAVVDGPANSPYAQIDDQGRYLVKFFFDASDLSDGVASTYIRMAQPHGGGTEGFHFPLRKGTEVMVAFSGGDPDRPLISGVVPDAQHPSPVTGNNHTLNIIRTGGNSHLEVEDLEGKQHMHLSTPTAATEIFMGGPTTKVFSDPGDANPNADGSTFNSVKATFYVGTTGTAGFCVGGNWWEDITGDKNVFVGGKTTIGYTGIHKLMVGADSNEFYYSHRNTTISSGRTDTVEGGGMVQTITGGLNQTVNDGGIQTVNGGWTHKVTGLNHDDYGSWTTKTTSWNGTFTGAVTMNAGGQVVTVTAAEIKLDAPTVTILGTEVKKKSSSWFEQFGAKGSHGLFKLDIVSGAKISLTNVKLDVTHVAASASNVKADTASISISNWAVKKEFKGVNLSDKGAHISKSAIRVLTFGFAKMG